MGIQEISLKLKMSKGQETPEPANVKKGTWTEHDNIDMCGQGDVQIIGEWMSKHSIEDLKRMVEEKGYSAFTISPNQESFGHAALKAFKYQLTTKHCKPTDYKCKIYIFTKDVDNGVAEEEKSGKGFAWTEHKDIDMSHQGDVEIIGDWKKTHSIDDLKKICEDKGYSAFTVSSGQPSFGHAALKKFDYKLTTNHCRPISETHKHPCTIYILHRDGKEQAKKKTKQVQPIDVEFVNGGIWTVYKDIDMNRQGDVEIIHDWKQKGLTIEDLKRKVEEKGYSAFTVSSGEPSFGLAALKKFPYNLTPNECRPISETHKHPCSIHIFNRFGSSQASKVVGFQLKLVKRGLSNQLKFADIDLLREGKVASGKISCHGGNAWLGRQYYEERVFHDWRYIESKCVTENDDLAVHLQYVDEQYIKLVNLNLVFDVSFWKMEEGNTINYVGANHEGVQTRLGGGGRDWTLNDDGTISAKHHPHLVIGI